MAMGPKGISVIIGIDKATRLSDVLETARIWPVFSIKYRDGAELIFSSAVKDQKLDQAMLDFLEDYRNVGLRIVYIPAEKTTSLQAAYNKGAAEAHGRYLLFTSADTYPKTDILKLYSEKLDDNTVVYGGIDYIKSPYNYSIIMRDARDFSPVYSSIDSAPEPWSVATDVNFALPRELFYEACGFESMRARPVVSVRRLIARACCIPGLAGRTRVTTAPDAIVVRIAGQDLYTRSQELMLEEGRYIRDYAETIRAKAKPCTEKPE